MQSDFVGDIQDVRVLESTIAVLEALPDVMQEELYDLMFQAKGILANLALMSLNQAMMSLSFGSNLDLDTPFEGVRISSPPKEATGHSRGLNQSDHDSDAPHNDFRRNISQSGSRTALGKNGGFETADSTLYAPTTYPSSPMKPLDGKLNAPSNRMDQFTPAIDDGLDPIAKINAIMLSIHQTMIDMGLAKPFESLGGVENVLGLLVHSGFPFLSPSAKAALNPPPVKPPTPKPHVPPQIKKPSVIPPPFKMPKTPPTPPTPPPMPKKPAPTPQATTRRRPTSHLPPLQHKPPTKPIKIKIDRTPFKERGYFVPIKPKTRPVLHPIPFSFDSRVLDFPKHSPGSYVSRGRPQTIKGIAWAALDPQVIQVPKHVNMDSGIDFIARAVVAKDLRGFSTYHERMEVATNLLIKIHPEMKDMVPSEPSLFGFEEGEFERIENVEEDVRVDSWGSLFDH
ncbi:UNVERIFIED_CONTAM: hypothetical protein HDU68_012049 [Siphonaria sp. JEL0065]|nr:hypothetical protein HDU68_012049 [Siphonaria sp. JEL0065]